MSATDVTAGIPATAAKREQFTSWRLIFTVICVVVPVSLWFAPLHSARGPGRDGDLQLHDFAWMTNIMEYGAAGLIGCLLFWALEIAKVETAFSGFANDTPWFLFGAILIGTAASKTGVPQRSARLSCHGSERVIRACCSGSS